MRFNYKTLEEIINDGWFGDDDPTVWSYEEYLDYVNDLNRIFPEAKLSKKEKIYLIELFKF